MLESYMDRRARVHCTAYYRHRLRLFRHLFKTMADPEIRHIDRNVYIYVCQITANVVAHNNLDQ